MYSNGLTVRFVYDDLDRISEVWYTKNSVESKAYSYEYDANGNLCKFLDHVNNRATRYKYDDQNRMTGYVESSGSTNLSSAVTTYDEQSRIHTISHSRDYAVSSASANLVTKYTYIARDVDSHSGGVWKAASSVNNLLRRETRTGTFSRWLDIRIGG